MNEWMTRALIVEKEIHETRQGLYQKVIIIDKDRFLKK